MDPEVPVPQWRLSPLGRSRIEAIASRDWVTGLAACVSSDETKAIETAAIIAAEAKAPIWVDPLSGEVDRSSTGYLSEDRHEEQRLRLFGEPETSANGWERAVDAQARVVAATDRFLDHAPAGNVALIGHGAVGAFLSCHLSGRAITLEADQTRAGSVFAFDRDTRALVFGWTEIENVS